MFSAVAALGELFSLYLQI
jgi:hypothetical protein